MFYNISKRKKFQCGANLCTPGPLYLIYRDLGTNKVNGYGTLFTVGINYLLTQTSLPF